MKRNTTILAIILVIVAALSRLLPHPPNVTPLAAIAMFGSFYLGRKWLMFLIPLAALYLSDFILNNFFLRAFYPDVEGIIWWSPIMMWVYLAFILSVFIGRAMLKELRITNLVTTTLVVSAIFYLLSNFGTWYHFGLYANDLSGLMACYVAGLPFFLNSILGNFFFVTVLFGAMYVLNTQFSKEIA